MAKKVKFVKNKGEKLNKVINTAPELNSGLIKPEKKKKVIKVKKNKKKVGK